MLLQVTFLCNAGVTFYNESMQDWVNVSADVPTGFPKHKYIKDIVECNGFYQPSIFTLRPYMLSGTQSGRKNDFSSVSAFVRGQETIRLYHSEAHGYISVNNGELVININGGGNEISDFWRIHEDGDVTSERGGVIELDQPIQLQHVLTGAYIALSHDEECAFLTQEYMLPESQLRLDGYWREEITRGETLRLSNTGRIFLGDSFENYFLSSIYSVCDNNDETNGAPEVTVISAKQRDGLSGRMLSPWRSFRKPCRQHCKMFKPVYRLYRRNYNRHRHSSPYMRTQSGSLKN